MQHRASFAVTGATSLVHNDNVMTQNHFVVVLFYHFVCHHVTVLVVRKKRKV